MRSTGFERAMLESEQAHYLPAIAKVQGRFGSVRHASTRRCDRDLLEVIETGDWVVVDADAETVTVVKRKIAGQAGETASAP